MNQTELIQLHGRLDEIRNDYMKDGQLTDASNAVQFVRKKKGSIGYSHEKGWVAADDGEFLWEFAPHRSEPSPAVIRKAISFFDEMEDSAEFMISNARTTDEETDGKKLRAHAKRSKQISRIHAMLALARADRDLLRMTLDKFDSHPELLAVANGVIDLRTGDWVRDPKFAHHHDDGSYSDRLPHEMLVDRLLTKQIPIEFEPGSVSDLWSDTVLDAMGGDEEMAQFLQDWLGYCLTGEASLQKMCVFTGGGSNAKSMIVDTVAEVFGPLAMSANASIFNDPKAGAPDPAGFRLRSKRGVFIDESNVKIEGFSAARFKALTSGGVITARDLHSSETDGSEFAVIAGFTMCTNFAPDFGGASDDSLWRRVLTVPFEQYYTDSPNEALGHKKRNSLLPGLIRAERKGVLGWLIEGAVRFYENGGQIHIPEKVASYTSQHRGEASKFGEFYRAGSRQGWLVEDSGSWVLKRDVYDAYKLYMELELAEDRYVLSMKRFNAELDTAAKNYGVSSSRRGEGVGWSGLRLVRDGKETPAEQNVKALKDHRIGQSNEQIRAHAAEVLNCGR